MIIIFHCLCTVLSKLCRTFSFRTGKPTLWYDIYQHSPTRFHPLAIKDSKGNITFDPLLSVQRYDRVSEILRNESTQVPIKKLVEFGCGPFSLFRFIKNVPGIEDMVFVDIDEEVVKEHLHRVQPMLYDYVQKRDARLRLNVFKGSVSEPDPCLAGADAVVAVELIEHLYPDTLDAVPYNIFGYIKPSLVIITTPNSDFNVIFPDFGKKKFRNIDHKFEWSRAEFQSWACNVSTRFPKYKVYFDGIGEAPPGHWILGCCSQAAIFIRDDTICDTIIQCKCTFQHCDTEKDKLLCSCVCEDCSPVHSFGVCTWNSCSKSSSGRNFYELVTNIDYPYEIDNRSEDQKTLDEIKYKISGYGFLYNPYYNGERNRTEIPLEVLTLRKDGKPPLAISEVRNLLLKDDDYKVEECVVGENRTLCVIYDHDMETGGSGSNTEASGYESDTKYPATLSDHQAAAQEDGQVSDWDLDSNDEDLENKDAVSQAEALIDSGYQKSPSSTEDSPQADAIFKNFSGAAAAPPQSPPPLPPRNEASSAAASSNFPAASPTINRTIPATPNKLSNLLSVFDKFSVDKVNELDAVRNERRYFHITASNLPHKEAMRKICQEIAKHPASNHHQAGPSNIQKRTKSRKVPHSLSSDSDECSSIDDVKCITNCILENTLNSIELNEEEKKKNKGHLIKDYQNIEEQAPVLINQAVIQAAQEIIAAAALPQPPVAAPAPALPPAVQGGGGVPAPAELPLLPVVVENGDLANNNRDREGNNMRPNHRHRDEDEAAAAIVIGNVDNNNQDHEEAAMMAAVLHHAAGVAGHDDDNGVRIDEIRVVAEGGEVENDEQDPLRGGAEVAWSSREALFDSSSQRDMLEEFDMLDSLHVDGIIVAVNIDSGVAGMPNVNNAESPHLAHLSITNHQHRLSKPTLNDQFQPGSILLPEENDFPNWLLQIFDENETTEEGEQTEDAHFYCQGDGLGVHPAIGDVNDGEEGDEEDSSSDSSTSGSVEFVNAEETASHAEMTAQQIPEGSNAASTVATDVAVAELLVMGTHLGPPPARVSSSVRSNSDQEEFFETAEELDSSSTSTTSAVTRST